MWTHFWDMRSGGGSKENFSHCYIEAPQEEAEIIFYNRFGHNPNRITCTCCGEDYSISEYETLEEATKFLRNTKTVEEYSASKDVLIITKKDIKKDDCVGEVPEEGYVWR